ncbi:hypothetical protein Tco_1053880 [Tanacetum coccineum]|uniref:Uncharacterized protein n=1 Tax=Tanacetum coccineum TaxID=301880 RepID=A0ABQ5GXM3_9ASTR
MNALELNISRRAFHESECLMKAQEVRAIQEIEKRLNESKMHTQKGMVNEGITLDACLDSKVSTYDNTLKEQQDESSSSGYAEMVRADKVFSDKENAVIRPSFDNDTLTETFHMLLPKEDNVNTRKQGLGFENQNDVDNPFILNKAKELTPSPYNIDEMGKNLLSNHKIISEEELKCEAEKRLKILIKGMKDDLKYVVSLEDEFDEKCLILDIQTEFFKTQFKSAISESYSHVYENGMFEQNSSLEMAKLLEENEHLKAQIQEMMFATAALKNELKKSKGNSVDTKFSKPLILRKPHLQPLRNQSVFRQPNAFKSKRPKFSKPRFASQVDVKNDLSILVSPHYWPNVREPAFAKPHLVIASSKSRNSSKNMPRFSSNDMVHNHYLEEAKKKTQERDKNSKTSVMPFVKLQNTANGSKPTPRSTNQMTRN